MSRSQKVNEPETMSTASAYLYKEQAECVQQVHQYLVEHLDSRVTQAELAQRYHISLTSLKGAFKQVLSLIHISEPTKRTPISYAVFCLKKKNKTKQKNKN